MNVGLTNIWLLWAIPLYMLSYYLVSLIGNDLFNEVVIYGLPALFALYDLYIRLTNKNGSVLDNLTFEDRGYVLHLFIFPFPVWFVGLVLFVIVFNY
jgi:hypothetical protein